MKVFVLSIDHSENLVRIWGRTEDRKKVCILTEYQYYVYLLPKENYFNEIIEEVKKLDYIKGFEIEDKRFLGKEYKAIKIYLDKKDYEKIKEFAEKLKEEGKIDGKKEVDLTISKKFSIDKKVFPLKWYDFEVEKVKSSKDTDYYRLINVKELNDDIYKFKVLAVDIEVLSKKAMPDPKTDPVIMVALYSDDFRKVITWKESNSDYAIYVKNEYELFEKLNETIREIDPDIIVGYNSNNFDFNYLYERAKVLNYEFSFGWDGKGFVLTKKKEEGKRFKILGIQHVDLYEVITNLFSGQLKSETYTLDEVAKEILGIGKEEMDMEKMYDLWKSGDIDKIVIYNLKDAELTYKLYKHFEKILMELGKLTGLSPYEVSNSTYGQLVENYLIKRSRDFDEIIPNRPKPEDVEKRKMITYKGAFVLEPKPGLYENIVVYDFRSLYPSIIIRYNISFDTIKCKHSECKENSIEIETSLGKEKVWFCTKKTGIVPSVLAQIFEERAMLKKKLKQLDPSSEEYKTLDGRQYALKILANSMYGYLGFPNSRWYCLECAAATTAQGRKHIQEIIKLAEEKSFKPIYGDTDSIFILVGNKDLALKFLEEVNKILPRPLELELEDFYIRGIFVTKRSKEAGAKKKYALLSESGKIKLRGFEVVRRDWSPIAKETQEKIIEILLREGNKEKIIQYLREIIQKIRRKEFPLEKFIIREQLRKNLEEYKVDAPHVVAAKKYKNKGYKVRKGFIVEYIVCSGGEKISDKIKLPEECKNKEYDPEYYIERQVFPAIESILASIGITKEQIISSQKTIMDFFRKS